jgi:aspartyl-tRNA(Asn)/glutamyl-tRNA(Gln) amidotransferase subunit B
MTAVEAPAVRDGWELVVGLEVHAELATATKLFCACPNRFGDPPNTNVCPVCLGLPGSLPVLNRHVVELAMRLGRALGCEVNASIFHRKNYFYPDMPKDYQISQYDQPINTGGGLVLASGRRIGLVRAHMEEDTGKSTHLGSGAGGRIHGADASLVDYNRAGVPLLEIVSAPDIRSVEEARHYVSELRSVLVATGVSDAKMEEGSMRVDANVSVRRTGDAAYGTRCEIKNLNSLRSLARAIAYEAQRQIEAIEAGGVVRQETRHWDEADGHTHTLRVKEDADDYRYFPEPDLVPVAPNAEWVSAVAATVPALPAQRREALAAATGLAPTAASVTLVVERQLDALAIAAVEAGADADRVMVHLEHDVPADGGALVQPARLAALTRMEVGGQLTATQAKVVLTAIVAAGGDADPEAVAAERGFRALDSDALATALDAAVAANPEAWTKYLGGDDKVAGAFVGAVMKATSGRADGKAVTTLLRQRRQSA